jgi:hypothetical protein
MNAEHAYFVSDNFQDVEKDFRKIRTRIREEEVIRFTPQNRILERGKGLSLTTNNNFKQMSGYFSYVLPLKHDSSEHTLLQSI